MGGAAEVQGLTYYMEGKGAKVHGLARCIADFVTSGSAGHARHMFMPCTNDWYKCLARLPHRLLWCHRCRGLLVRVEKLLGDLERAELLVPSKYFAVLQLKADTALQQRVVWYICGDGRRCNDV